MTVYVVQAHRRYNKDTGEYEDVHDLSPAAEFGELRYLLTPTAAPWDTDSILADLWDGLGSFSDGDYLLMVGNPVLVGLATAVASEVSGGRINFLQWSGRERSYTPVSAQVFALDPRPIDP